MTLLLSLMLPAKAMADDLQRGAWWGRISENGVAIRSEPSAESKLLGTFTTENRVKILQEIAGQSIEGNDVWYKIDGGAYPGAYIFSAYVRKIDQPTPPEKIVPPGGAGENGYWIDVDLNKKILTLLKGSDPVFVTYAAVGKNISPTVTGTYQVWYKTRSTRMRGRPPAVPYAYDLPGVPFSMFYHGSYAIHGTYWHDKFGTQQSAGCTNLTRDDAAYLYEIISPNDGGISQSIRSNAQNPGTIIVNHF